MNIDSPIIISFEDKLCAVAVLRHPPVKNSKNEIGNVGEWGPVKISTLENPGPMYFQFSNDVMKSCDSQKREFLLPQHNIINLITYRGGYCKLALKSPADASIFQSYIRSLKLRPMRVFWLWVKYLIIILGLFC